MKKLVLYFSRADENYYGGAYKYVTKGNTEVVAEKIAKLTGADLFKIEPTTPYSKVYNECIEQAKKDLQQRTRPSVKAIPTNLDQYDTIYLGYPIYWGKFPMHIFTVLEQIDTAGKTIKPFSTHEGSGLGTSMEDVRKLCPKAKISSGLAISGSGVQRCDSQLQNWV